MNISIFGLGYVGTVSAACLADAGHHVTGIDTSREKVDLINNGKSPVIETGLDELIREQVQSGRLKATTDPVETVKATDVVLISVGTPSRRDGSLNLDFLDTVAEQIGDALKTSDRFHSIAIRSTVPPGTLSDLEKRIAEVSGKTPGKDFGVAVNPEFLREGSAIRDFKSPPYTLVGTDCPRTGELLREMYAPIPAEFILTPPGPAELIKYINNSFHALKVAFGNEVGRICVEHNIDSHAVMDLFCRDTSLNISPCYFRPGFAYGGSCLPKDLAALNHLARFSTVNTPLLSHIQSSNDAHITHGINLIMSHGCRRIGLLGLSFKPGTDDLRQSPLVTLVETLIGKGYHIRIYDPNINIARLVGANKTYINEHIRHISDLLVETPDDLLEFSDCIVIGHRSKEFVEVTKKIRPDQKIIDFVRIDPDRTSGGNYSGICW